METALVKKALHNAIGNVRKLPKGTIFHSDQGSQYAAKEFRNLLVFYGLIQSMSRRGQCWDNSPMESFFGTLKDEYDSTKWCWFESLEEARSGLFEFIEIYYNRNRIHSSIDYKEPSRYK